MTEIENSITSCDGNIVTYKVFHSEKKSEQPSRVNYDAIFLVHGLASNMTRWTEFVINTSLKNQTDLVRLDLRGHGKSMSYSRITSRDWCQDIQQIMSKEEYSRILLIGHSLGAQISMQFANIYPDKTFGIVLIDPVFPNALKGMLGVVRRFRFILLGLIYFLLALAKLGFNKKNRPYRDLHELDMKTREILAMNTDKNIANLYMNPVDDLIYIPFVNFCQDMFEVTRKVPNLKTIKSAVLCLLSKGAVVSNMDLTKLHINQFPNYEIQIIDADHWLLTEKPIESRNKIEKWCLKLLK
jgi:pimeloyl-ACP methyl ester carboxylesterase